MTYHTVKSIFGTFSALVILLITYLDSVASHTSTIDCFTKTITFWNAHEEESVTLTDATTCPKACLSHCLCTLTNNAFVNRCDAEEKEVVEVIFPQNVSTLYLANYSLDGLHQYAFKKLAGSLNVLYLNNNTLSQLHAGVFDGLANLEYLYLYYNELKEIPPGVFTDLVSLKKLDLASNALTDLELGIFAGLAQLRILSLELNKLSNLKPRIFEELIHLETLNVQSNNLTTIQLGGFKGLGRLLFLEMDRNQLRILTSGTFNGLNNLEEIDMDHNEIQTLPLDIFQDLTNIIELDIDHNLLSTLQPGVFDDLINLDELELNDNLLTNIDMGLFKHLRNLKRLSISNNMLTELNSETFDGLNNLVELHSSHNFFAELNPLFFQDIINLETLFLDNDNIVGLNHNVFSSLKHLKVLSLAQNRISYVPSDIFQNTSLLKHLNLSRNKLQELSPETFPNSLITLDLTYNPLLWVRHNVFDNLAAMTTVYVDKFATCCFILQAKCSFESPPSPFISCKRLLPYAFLRVVIWFLGIATIIGNALVLLSRCRKKQRLYVQFLFISNLSLSDFFMGIYMITLISVDMYYTHFFPSYSESWRHSTLCRAAGALSVLSSEASVFFITFISLDRFMAVNFPFSAIRLRKTSARFVVVILWVVALLISISSVLIPVVSPKLYDVSEICVGLPISRSNSYVIETQHFNLNTSSLKTGFDIATTVQAKFIESKSSMYFSIAIFTGLNLLCFMIVAFCYISIFVTAKQTSSEAGRSRMVDDEIRMAIKMAGIVFSDFCCWMVVVVLSILVQSGVVTIQPVAYAWIATFVLPINACVNPFLYTLASLISDYFRKHRDATSDKNLKLQSHSLSVDQQAS